MSITGWIGIARMVRGQVLSLKATDYVRAAQGMGANTSHIIRHHLIRNALTPVVVMVTLGVPGSMMAEAGLSFLGLGITPPMTSWGQMMGLYQQYIQSAWHLIVFPALVLSLTMLAWFQLRDGLRDALDPTLRVWPVRIPTRAQGLLHSRSSFYSRYSRFRSSPAFLNLLLFLPAPPRGDSL